MASAELSGDKYYTLYNSEAKVGLKFNGPEVTTIVEGGWAERNGVEVDDEIYMVAGKPFKTMTNAERLKAFQEAPRPLEIQFKRPMLKDVYYSVNLTEKKIGMTMKGNFVKTVDPKGWGGVNGVQVGDEIAELAGEGYAQLTDEQRLQIFAGPRPIMLRFVRRNQLTVSALKAEKKEEELKQEQAKAAALADTSEKGIDPTHARTSVKDMQDNADLVAISPKPARGGAMSGFCLCCATAPDASTEIAVSD